MSAIRATQRLYRTLDDRVVAEGHPDGAFLLAAAGAEIPDGYDIPAHLIEVKAEDAAEDKSVDLVEDKADTPAGNKRATKAK